jgi:hypothetical protein
MVHGNSTSPAQTAATFGEIRNANGTLRAISDFTDAELASFSPARLVLLKELAEAQIKVETINEAIVEAKSVIDEMVRQRRAFEAAHGRKWRRTFMDCWREGTTSGALQAPQKAAS